MKLDRLIPVNDLNETKTSNPPEEPKKNKFKVSVRYRSDRDPAMREILKFDPKAEFKTRGGWAFKVQTKLNSNLLHTILLAKQLGDIFEIKKVWFF